MQIKRVLVVDDERIIRFVLRTHLENDGYEVQEAADGEEALTLLRQSIPDVIFLDLLMPRLDGIEFLKRMKNITSTPRIIILTAYGSMFEEASQLGAADFIEKPMNPEKIRQTLARLS